MMRLELKRLGSLFLGGAVLVAPVCALAEEQPSSSPVLDEAALAAATQGAAPDLGGTPSARGFEPEAGGDGRRTVGRFVPNLGRNLVGVFSGDNLRPLLAGAALTGVGSLFDDPTRRFVAANHPVPGFGSVGQTAGGAPLIAPLSAMMFLAGRASHDGRFRAASYDALQATIVSQTYTFALKSSVGRTRPDGSDNQSFPSGHTSNAFAWAAIANHYYGKKAGIAAYAAAGLIGLSRIDNNKHNVSDVLAGATLGYIVGRTTVRKDGEPLHGQTRVSLTPSFAPSGGGVGVGVSVEF